MKKSLFIFFALITFTNVSYASFPVAETIEVKEDTLQIEEIKQYHSNLVKMGIDLNDCKCESCRKSNGKDNTIQQSGATGLYILSGLILLGVIIWGAIGLTRLYNCVDSGSGLRTMFSLIYLTSFSSVVFASIDNLLSRKIICIVINSSHNYSK